MATAVLILMILSASISAIMAFGMADGPKRVGHAVGAVLYGGSAWWLYFDSGLFG